MTVRISVSPRLPKALLALAKTLESIDDRVECFVDFRDTFVRFGSIDFDRFVTSRACDGGVSLEPSDCLLDFLSACGASDFDIAGIDIENHGSPFHE